MNVGLASPIGSINNSQKLGQVMNNANSFKSSFAALLQPQTQLNLTNADGEVVNIAEVMKNILKLLTEDKSSTVDSLKLLDSSEITDDQITDLLGTNDKDLKDQLSDLIDDLMALFGNNTTTIQQLNTVKKAMQDGQFIKGANELLSMIVKLPTESIQKINPETFQFMAKSMKAIETIGKMVDLSKDGIKNMVNLREGLQNLIFKVEQIIKSQSNQNKNAILQNSFQNLLLSQRERQTNDAQATDVQSTNSLETVDSNVNIQNNMQQLSKVEQLVLHVGKDAKPVNYQQFIKDFSNILAKSQFMQSDGTNRLLIKLYPEHLGSLRIEVLQDNGILTAKMFATTGAAKDILDSQLHQLKSAFSQQNIQVDKVDVIFTQPETQKFDRGNQQQQQPSGQQQKFHNNEADEETDVTFSDVLSQSLIEEKI